MGITSFFLLATEVLRWDLTITTGLSAKNLAIYLVATFLALRMVVSRTSITAGGSMHAAFIVQIAYALVTLLVASMVIDYQSYDLIASGIRLKGSLVDYYIFFLVFLFGVQTAEEALKVIKWILAGAVFANLATILDVVGIWNLGYTERFDGRTQGAIGESNQYAAYIILFIPGLFAAAVASRGLLRVAWLGGALLSCAALVMTASRGGFVGMIVGCAIGLYLFRHLISYNRVAGWAAGSLLVFVLVMSVSDYGGLLTERVFGQTSNIDATEASSGRTEIWANLFYTMFQQPITFLTGFGWNVYWSMPFRFSPHNHYFASWFNLGLVGLICGSYLIFSAIGRARRASLDAKPPLRGQLIAFVIGGTALAVAVFFVDLHTPWVYFWMYTGVIVRLATCVQQMPIVVPAPEPLEEVGRDGRRRPRVLKPALARDSYGWSGGSGRDTA
ncbi:MAG: O-antigen ligase family protein [Steroidobacteraceae bacterium]|nr:O-antigen ligase family protein [Steroidobacteraceae bacterium]